jgi:ubiquitin carboxyl-terminal hydrolase 10
MFMREFRVVSLDPKVTIKCEDMEALGAPFAPEFVYEAIRKLKRFSHMRASTHLDSVARYAG